MDDLPADTAAQFSAGMLYAWSGQTIDERDYLVSCSFECPIVKKQLSAAFDDYTAGAYRAANKHIKHCEPWW